MNIQSGHLISSDQSLPIVIAGPCSAETEEQLIGTARQLHQDGIKILRAGIWKPRTKPGGFEGVGRVGLKWMVNAKKEFGLKIATEVANSRHVEEALKEGIDILWIGARTTTNPFAVHEIAEALKGIDIQVLVKNPVNPDIELWVGALERFNNVGITKLGAVHRGFSSFDEKLYRNIPYWHIPIELKRRYPQLPLLCDPSHIGGRRDLIAPISQQAMDMNFDGLMLEVHCCPDEAWSDKKQQITPDELKQILYNLVIRDKNNDFDELAPLRQQIDQLDQQILQLLNKRLSLSNEIGLLKKDRNMTVVQTERYDEILTTRLMQAKEMGMNLQFVKRLLEIVHQESVKQQIELFGKK